MEESDRGLKEVLAEFERRTGLPGVEREFKERTDGGALIIYLANPNDRFYRILQEVLSSAPTEPQAPPATIKTRAEGNRVQSPEGRYLLRTLSESLNISRFSFKEDFFARYTKSVSGAEAQVTAAANHVVFGRRGAGKSSLLLYALHARDPVNQPSAWIDMQLYEKRADNRVVLDLFSEVMKQCEPLLRLNPELSITQALVDRLRNNGTLADDTIGKILPDLRRLFGRNASGAKDLFIFLDDFHALDVDLQPKLPGFIYSVTRGNNIFLKLSAIETLTKTWDSQAHTGLQAPHDAQTIKLDYNLTMPDKAAKHIEAILDAHAVYCGLPSVRFLCTSSEVISRLVWVSAGVPRDALNMFAQAMTKGATVGQNRVSVTNVNLAASEMVSQKLRELEIDAPAPEEGELRDVLERVKDFCVKEKRKNAFLIEIRNDSSLYRQVLKLIDLRLVHVISEGITVGEAGRKYLGLILDYGFYTGIRAAQSVDLFNKQTERVAYKDLRKLPVLAEPRQA